MAPSPRPPVVRFSKSITMGEVGVGVADARFRKERLIETSMVAENKIKALKAAKVLMLALFVLYV